MQEIRPNPGPQELFLRSPADIVLYGGGAGCGKSYALLMECARHKNVKDFGAVVFRRTYPEIRNEGGLWDESGRIYPLLGATPNISALSWKWSSGSTVSFAHMQGETDKYSYQGAQIALMCFDELTHFTDGMFWYMLSRNRSTCGVKPYVRCTTNPDSDSWVRKLVDWWIGPDGYAIEKRSGVVRWLVKEDRELHWFDTQPQAQAYADRTGLGVKSFTFIPAKLRDNPKGDPGYEENLKSLHIVDRERLLMGNWNITYSAGTFFKREYFRMVDALPAGHRNTVRYWDRAATQGGGDWTVGCRGSIDAKGFVYVEDVVRGQWSPAGVQQAIRAAAERDGQSVTVYLEQEPGSSGVADVQAIIRHLAGYKAKAVRKTGSKADEAKPLAAQVEAGNVSLLRGPWNDAFLRELEAFDGQCKRHDDQADAVSGAYRMLTSNTTSVIGNG